MSSPDMVMTAYASFNAMSNEIAQNGGAWYDLVLLNKPFTNLFPQTNSTIIPHQTMGGITDLIALTGGMAVNIVIPSDVVQLNQKFTNTFTYIACEVKPDGDTRDKGQVYGTPYNTPVEWCPKMSEFSFTSSMKLGSNPWVVYVASEAPKMIYNTIYIGNIKLTVALSPSDTTIRSTPTIATFLSSINPNLVTPSRSAGSSAVLNGTGSPGAGSTSTSVTSLSTTPSTSFSLTRAVQSEGEGSSLDSDSPSSHSSTPSSSSPQSNQVKVNVAAIVGGTLGGLALLGLILFLTTLYVRRRNKRARGEETQKRDSSVWREIRMSEPEPFIPDTLRQTSQDVMPGPRKTER